MNVLTKQQTTCWARWIASRPRRASQPDEPPFLGRAGSTQARPGCARPCARSEGLLAPLRRRYEAEPLARPGLDN
eukprot:2958089-Amphidinium_carterae.1